MLLVFGQTKRNKDRSVWHGVVITEKTNRKSKVTFSTFFWTSQPNKDELHCKHLTNSRFLRISVSNICPADWWNAPLTLQDLAEVIRIILTMGGSPFCSHGDSLAVMLQYPRTLFHLPLPENKARIHMNLSISN